MIGMQGGGGGGKRGPRVPLPKFSVVDLVNLSDSFYRHCRIGLEAHPVFDEAYEDLTAFGIPVEMKSMGGFEHHVPVMPWGWHVPVQFDT